MSDGNLEVIQERAGDIAFAHEARRIYDVVARTVKKRLFAVMTPNHENEYLSRWNGMHVNLQDLGVSEHLPEILQDLTLVFAWGTPDDPISGAYYVSPREEMPDGAIVIGYNIGKADRQPFRLSRSAKRARAKLSHMTKNAEMGGDEDILEFIPKLLDARRTAFIHELRHAYDQLVRDDDGQMSDYMQDSTKASGGESKADAHAKNFTSDDELNAYITQGIEDTIEDFVKSSRGRPTKKEATKWAPNGTALWNRFLDNVAGAVRHHNGEEKLMKRAAARVADVWDDYVANLNESHQINEAFGGMELVELQSSGPMTAWALLRGGKVVAGAQTLEAGNDWQIVKTLWSDTSQAAYAILMGMLSSTQGLVPDTSVSPAAQEVIKRWYKKHEYDMEYIVDDPMSKGNKIEPFLSAGYIAGPGVKDVAEKRTLTSKDKGWEGLVNAVRTGFVSAYTDLKRTKQSDFARSKKQESRLFEGLLTEAFKDLELVKMGGDHDEKTQHWGLMKDDIVLAGMVTTTNGSWDIVETLWAKTAPAAYALLMSALSNIDTKGLVPSDDVSPAAQSVIKRWYDKYKDDPEYVEHLDMYREKKGKPYLNAGYLPGPNVKSVAYFSHVLDDALADEIKRDIDRGFERAYANIKKSKTDQSFDDALSRSDWTELLDWIMRFNAGGSRERGFAKHWTQKNIEKITQGSSDPDFDILDWNAVLKRLDLPTIQEGRIIREMDEDLNDQIEELMRLPEYKTVISFAEMMMDDDESSYGPAELQAIARNLYLSEHPELKAKQLASAPSQYRERVKKELEGWGLRFEPRKAQKATRGFSSPLNGSNRFAGNHGGSGFTNSYNREPDSGRTFDPNDKGGLGMGSRRK